MNRWLRAGLSIALALLLGACATLPKDVVRAPSQAIPASIDTDLGRIAAASTPAGIEAGASGFRLLSWSAQSLFARVELAKRAQRSLDLQYYELHDDETGRLLMRTLRDAAQRGVRVRLLLDDLYTAGSDPVLRALAAYPNIELRLFNPFGAGRVSALGRWLNLASDFRRLNHRMHNKLFVADGAVAVVGGRNMADGYFLRDPGANFIDFDALAIGPVVPQLQYIFDRYWNSEHVYPIADVLRPGDPPETLRARFDALMAPYANRKPHEPPALDAYGIPPVAADLDAGMPRLIWAEASAYADSPDKVVTGVKGADLRNTVTYHNLDTFRQAQSEVLLVSPYFVPGPIGLKHIREARDRGLRLRFVTNSMGATDEPLASLAYERYRVEMLKMGVELYELSSEQLHRDPEFRKGFGSSRAQLHVKLAVVDGATMVLGSMNLDNRSATTNTELAVTIHSAELVQRTLKWFNSTNFETDVRGLYRVQLAPDGHSLKWVALLGGRRTETIEGEPEVDRWQRFKLFLMSLFVSEDLL
jgi:phosphatidylserine/phosphatidylglycerophosphate/cardiolipin synthase-like enzyme